MEDTDYHVTTSQYAREAEDEADRKEEAGRRNKKKKNLRLKTSRHAIAVVANVAVKAAVKVS